MTHRPRKTLSERGAGKLVRHRALLFSLALLLLVAAWPVARRLQFDQSIESLYAGDDPILQRYRESKRLFGGDEFAMIAFTDPQLLNPRTGVVSEAAAQRLKELTRELNQIRGIQPQSTQDLAHLTERTITLLDRKADEADRLKGFFIRAFKSTGIKRVYQQVRGLLLGKDNQTTAVVVRFVPEDRLPPGMTRGGTIAEIRAVARRFGERHKLKVAVVGEPVQVHDMFRYVEEDGRTLFFWSMAALSVVILLLFRSLRWVLLPVLVVVTTIGWTDALLVLSQMKLSMVSSMMNSLVSIIGVATVMHLTVHYREERQQNNRREALRRTLSDLLPAIFWTCATTAVGFAALLSSAITPVRSFGLMMALAALMVFVAVGAVLPGGTLLGRFDADPRDTPAEDQLSGALTRLTEGVQQYPWTVSLVLFGIFGFAAAGLTRLTVETDFSKNFRKSSPIVQSLQFVETKLGGAGTWEVRFPAPEILTEEYLDNVRSLAVRLRKEFVEEGQGDITRVVALTDGLDAVPRRLFPRLEERMQMLQELQPEFLPSLYNAAAGRMRIVLRAREQQQSATKLALIARVEEVARKWQRGELAPALQKKGDIQTSGLYVLLAFLIDNLLKDQLVSFLLAAMGIVLMMSVAFRSLLIGLLMLLPNIFPIVLVVGGIGWLSIPVNIATAMIASVSMGLTVDFSIHYLFGYFRGRQAGLSPPQALKNTLHNVGRALVFSNLALIVGFSVLTLSHFIPLVYFGILVSFAMFGGLMGSLIFLPLILLWIDRPVRNSEVVHCETPLRNTLPLSPENVLPAENALQENRGEDLPPPLPVDPEPETD